MSDAQTISFDARVDAEAHRDFRVRNANRQFVGFQITERSDTRFKVQPILESMPGCGFVGILLLAVSAFACFKFIEPFVTDQSHDEWMSKLCVALVAGGFGMASVSAGFTGIFSITRMLIDSEAREIQVAYGRGRRVQTIAFADLAQVSVHVDAKHRFVVSLDRLNRQAIRLPWLGSVWNEGGSYPVQMAMVIASRTGCAMRVALPLMVMVMDEFGRMPLVNKQCLAALQLQPKPPIEKTVRPRVDQFVEALATVRKAAEQKQAVAATTTLDVKREAERWGMLKPSVGDVEVGDDESSALEPIGLTYDEAITGDMQPHKPSLATLGEEGVGEQIVNIVGDDAVPLATFKLRPYLYHKPWVLLVAGFFLGIGFGAFAYIEITGIKPVPTLQMISFAIIGIVLAFAIPKPTRWVRLLLYEDVVIRVNSRGVVQSMPVVSLELFHRSENIALAALSAMTQDHGHETVRLIGADAWRFLMYQPAAINLQRLMKERCPNAIFITGDGHVHMPPRPADWRESDWSVLMRRWLRQSFGTEINHTVLASALLLFAGAGMIVWLITAASDGQIQSDGREVGKGGVLVVLLFIFGCFGLGLASLQWNRYRRLRTLLDAPRPDEEFIETTKTGHLKYQLDRPRPKVVTAGESALVVVSLPLLVVPFLGFAVAIAALARTWGKDGPWNNICWISVIGSAAWTGTVAIGLVIEAMT